MSAAEWAKINDLGAEVRKMAIEVSNNGKSEERTIARGRGNPQAFPVYDAALRGAFLQKDTTEDADLNVARQLDYARHFADVIIQELRGLSEDTLIGILNGHGVEVAISREKDSYAASLGVERGPQAGEGFSKSQTLHSRRRIQWQYEFYERISKNIGQFLAAALEITYKSEANNDPNLAPEPTINIENKGNDEILIKIRFRTASRPVTTGAKWKERQLDAQGRMPE